MDHIVIEQLKWRYAVKKYNPTKKVSESDLDVLKEVLTLVPTSNGLQPYHFFIIENPEIRAQLKEKSFNQSQITDASHLVVICAHKETKDDHIDAFMQLTAEVRELTMESLLPYQTHLKNSLVGKDEQQHLSANEKQCYIALGQLLQSAAILKVDATPMEGFSPEGYDEVLKLSEQNLKATVICTLGYRADDDAFQFMGKVRRDANAIFTIL